MVRELTKFEKEYLYKEYKPCCDECDYLIRNAHETKGPFGLRTRYFPKCFKLQIKLTRYDLTDASLPPCKLELWQGTLDIEYSLDLCYENGKLMVK